MTNPRLQAQDEKFYAEVGRQRRRRPPVRKAAPSANARRYSSADEIPRPRNAHHDRPYVFGQEPLF